jgi:ABC-type glycerol-3-phosphate transport system substrate-binding protein
MEAKKLTRRDFLLFSAAAATGAVLAGCQPAEPEIAKEEVIVKETVVVEGEPVEVTRIVEVEKVVTATPPPEPIELLMWDPTHTPIQELMADLIPECTALYPDVTLKYEHVQYDEVHTKTAIAMAGGGGPDIFQVNSWAWPMFIEKGTVLELDPLAFGVDSLSELEAQYVPNLLNAFKVGGKLSVVPTCASSYLPDYNPAVYTEGYPETWDELIQVAKGITKQEGGTFTAIAHRFTVKNGEQMLANLGPFVWEHGGDFLNEDMTRCILNQPEGVAGVTLMRKMVDENVWVPDFPWSGELFVDGSVGACMCGDWCLGGVDAMTDEAGLPRMQLAPVCVLEKGGQTVNYMVPGAYLVNANTKHAFEAWRTIAFFTNDDNSRRWLEEIQMFSGRLGPWVEESEKADPRLKVAHEQLSFGTVGIMTSKYQEIVDVLVPAAQAIMLENRPIQQTLDEASAKVDEVLAAA